MGDRIRLVFRNQYGFNNCKVTINCYIWKLYKVKKY